MSRLNNFRSSMTYRATCLVALLQLLGVQIGCGDATLKDDREVIAALKQARALSEHDILVAKELGEGHILSLDLIGKDITKVLPRIDGLKGIRSLEINVRKYKVSELEALGRLKSLERLSIVCDAVHMPALAGLTTIRELKCFKCQLSDQSLSHLSRMKDLTRLDLSYTPITGAGLRFLTESSQVKELLLNGTNLRDEAVPFIVANFPVLERLYCADTQVTIEGALQLAELPFLMDMVFPNEMFGELPQTASREQRQKAILALEISKGNFAVEYLQRYAKAKEAARSRGEPVPNPDVYPFKGAPSLERVDLSFLNPDHIPKDNSDNENLKAPQD